MRRVSVIGGSCTGKTTLARELARKLGVPHIELDALHHDPGWQEAPADVFQSRVRAALEAASHGWVADGNYHGKLGTFVLQHADTVVFLDLPRRTALRRVLWRTLRRSWTREELWNGNRESFRIAFSRDSIVWWVLTRHGTHRKKWPPRLAPLTHLDVVRLRSPREVREWLQSIQPTASTSGSSNGSERQKTPPSVET
ncbi:MAG TPA: AAA family ATPase [Gaiellaceae bacterium]|nr:AAA family ATPase [Gaiellaceae bacterium]